MRKVRWGVLGVANIAVKKVIPAMQRGSSSEVIAIASRDFSRADAAATSLGISSAYGSYDDLLDDPDVEAVYIPLPNHLHVPWAIRAAERASTLVQRQRAETLDALAAAYAAAGQFDRALQAVADALRAPDAAPIAGALRERQELYKRRQVYRAPAGVQ